MLNNEHDEFDLGLAELEELSNGVIDLIQAGRLDEAERQCLELRRLFPGLHDWMERTAAVAEAKGETGRAIEHYRCCIDFLERHPGEFDWESIGFYRGEIERLERSR